MTNISAIKTGGLEEKIFLIADSMASDSQTQTKYDKYQKIYKSDNMLLTGTGQASLIRLLAHEFLKGGNEHIEETAEHLLSFAENNIKYDDIDSQFDIILAGKNEKGKPDMALIYFPVDEGTIIEKMIAKEYGEEPEIKSEDFKDEWDYMSNLTSIFDGSSEELASQRFAKLKKYELTDTNDPIETFSTTYDILNAATQDSGVNDKLQLGIVSKDKTKLLYNPDTSFDPKTNSCKNYIKEMTGQELENPSKYENDEEGFLKAYDKAIKINPFFEDFYNAVQTDLDAYSRIKKNIIAAKAAGDGRFDTPKILERMQTEKQKRKEQVKNAYNAVMSDNWNDKITYIEDFEQRRKEYRQTRK